MFIPAREFKDKGDALAIGQRIRLDHSCGDGNTLIVSRDARGISAYCFRCKEKGWVPVQRSLTERIADLAGASDQDHTATGSIELPGPGKFDTNDWPDEALLYFFRAGISRDEIERLRFYWNPRMERVIMPIRDSTDSVIFWQARGFDGIRPKAISPQAERSRIVARYGQGSVLCLTEDILSAVKVAGVPGIMAWALLGTVLSKPVALEIAELKLPVILALDDDAAGRAGAAKAAQLLSLLGVWVKQVYFGKDPKLIPRDELMAKINETLEDYQWHAISALAQFQF